MAYYNTYPDPDWDSEYDSTWEDDDAYEDLKKSKAKQSREHNSWNRPWKKASVDLQNYRHGYDGYKQGPNLKFYRNQIPFQPHGIYIDELHTYWKDDYHILEANHNYIQWLFPLQEHGVNRCATPLTRAELQSMVNDEDVRRRFLQSYKLMLGFYGIQLVDEETGKVARAENWQERFSNLNFHTHNNLRITRILKCLGEMGYQHYQTPLVRFFLEETLCHGNLQQVKQSALEYFIFTVKNKEERKKLVLFAWEHYEPKYKFIWGPVELLRKIKPPCRTSKGKPHKRGYVDIPRWQNNDMNKNYDDTTERGEENENNDEMTVHGREDEENYEMTELGMEKENYDDMTGLGREKENNDDMTGLGREKENYDDMTGLGREKENYDDMTGLGREKENYDDMTGLGREKENYDDMTGLGREKENNDDMTGLGRENDYKDSMKEPEMGNNKDNDIDLKEPGRGVSENDLKEDNRNKDFGKICEQKENEDDSTNTPDSEGVEGLKKNSCGVEDRLHRESDGQLLSVTSPSCTKQKRCLKTPEQEQKKERHLTGREDNENQYKNELEEHGRGPTEEVANKPKKIDNKDHNKYSLNVVSGEIGDFKEDTDSEKDNVGKVCKPENVENNSIHTAGSQSAKRVKKNNSEAESDQQKELEEQEKRTTEEGWYSEKQQEDMKKPVMEEQRHNEIQEHRELSEDHPKDNTNDPAYENNKHHYEDNTNEPGEETEEKDLENDINSKNKNAGNVYKQDSGEKASVHMVHLPVSTELKNIRTKESDRSPLTKPVSQSKTTFQSVTGSEREDSLLHDEWSSKKVSRKARAISSEDPNPEKSENIMKETLQAKNVEAIEKDKEPDKCCQVKHGSGAELKELFKEPTHAVNIGEIETESKSSVTKSDNNMGKAQSMEKCCLDKDDNGTQLLSKVENPAENMDVKTKSENLLISYDLDNDMGMVRRADESLESGVAEDKEIDTAAQSSKRSSKKKKRNLQRKKHNATKTSNL